ncbi:6-phosphogluconolactonase [Eubacteriales bacterium OttesenSCG-928-K08]|nr:6-phosphogluconolactonase [Eubacteriales bacterium OttesenSCG-928-K08]
MGTMIYKDAQAAGAAAATLLAAQFIQKPNSVVGLCVSGQSISIYRQLAAMTAAGILDWSETSLFLTSELAGRSREGLVCEFLSRHLLDAIGLNVSRIYRPNHIAINLEDACASFEKNLAEAGDMDILLLPLGKGGHIAYNSSSSELSAFTHVEDLTDEAAEECASMFAPNSNAPLQMVTMGMSTLLSAKRIILCAFGKQAAKPVADMMSSRITTEIPASMLQLHPNVTYMLDEEAAIYL